MYRWFHKPVSVNLFMDNKLHANRDETEFYCELDATLQAIDKHYADMIDLSISN